MESSWVPRGIVMIPAQPFMSVTGPHVYTMHWTVAKQLVVVVVIRSESWQELRAIDCTRTPGQVFFCCFSCCFTSDPGIVVAGQPDTLATTFSASCRQTRSLWISLHHSCYSFVWYLNTVCASGYGAKRRSLHEAKECVCIADMTCKDLSPLADVRNVARSSR